MARRSWEHTWPSYESTKPIRPEKGIATSRQRGDMATTWWSGRLVSLLDSYGLGGRMQRGRRYARQGQLVGFDVQPGLLIAAVQGSRSTPYAVRVASRQLSEEQWGHVHTAIESRVSFAAQLLAGAVPPELEAVFDDAGVPLLPARWADVQAECSCPDFENPCKHIAAVLYVFADRLDDDPWLLLRWRGRERDQVLAHLRSPESERPAVAPWWPLVPGAPLPPVDVHRDAWEVGDSGAALTRLGPLDVSVKSSPVTDVLSELYAAIAEGSPE